MSSRRSGRSSNNILEDIIPEVHNVGSKRKIDHIEVIDDEEEEEEGSRNVYTEVGFSIGFLKTDFNCTEKEENNFKSLSKDARDQCVKVISRLFLFRGSRSEIISRSTIHESLSAIDKTYKNHVNAILIRVQKFLSDNLGYHIVNETNIIGIKEPKKENFYLSSSLESMRLREVLVFGNNNNNNNAFVGFVVKVCQAVFMSPGRKITSRDLLKELRRVDPRFPETVSSSKKSATTTVTTTKTVVGDLEDDYLGLMKRMTKEHYLFSTKDADEADNLGPRFFLELGKTDLVKMYFTTIGESVDEHRLEELRREDAEEEKED